jgi:hypothetical protein
LAIFRHRFLPANKLVHTPEGGLLRGRRASIASRRFFALMEQLHPGLHIRTAQWSIGEEQPDDSGLRIDGVIRRPPPLRPLALEFCGCYFHGLLFLPFLSMCVKVMHINRLSRVLSTGRAAVGRWPNGCHAAGEDRTSSDGA